LTCLPINPTFKVIYTAQHNTSTSDVKRSWRRTLATDIVSRTSRITTRWIITYLLCRRRTQILLLYVSTFDRLSPPPVVRMRRADVREPPPCPVGKSSENGKTNRRSRRRRRRARAIRPSGTVIAATLFRASASLRARTQRAHDRRRETTVDNDWTTDRGIWYTCRGHWTAAGTSH